MVQWPGLLSAHDMCQSAVRGLWWYVSCRRVSVASGSNMSDFNQSQMSPRWFEQTLTVHHDAWDLAELSR